MKVSKLIILLVITSFWSCNKDKSSWESAQSNNTVTSYKDYISKFPDGIYKNKADSCIQVLVWSDSQKSNTVESYENYLNLYPSGYYKIKADSILEETLWNGASNNTNMEYYVKYNDKFPNGRYIQKVKNYIDRYLIGVNHAGFFKVGMSIPNGVFKGFNINVIQEKFTDVVNGDVSRTHYYVYEGNEKVIELIEVGNKVYRIDVYSKKFRTKYNIGVGSSISDFIEKYPINAFWYANHDTDALDWYEYLITTYMEAKGENGIAFQIPYKDFIGKFKSFGTCYERTDFKKESVINSINISEGKYDDSDFEKNVAEYKAEFKKREEEYAKEDQERQAANRSSQSNSNSSSNSNNSYKRSYRDNFESRSAVFEFLANHTFVSSNGSRVRYDMSTITINFSNGKQLEFTNVELLGFNQNTARIRAMWVGNGSTVTFTLDSASGTVTDNDGTLYRAGN